jgi:hypothetical protein
MPDTNDSHGKSKIIFEDYDWLIVEPFDYDSYVYNAPEGMKSKWYQFSEGDVYFIVDKNNNATYAGGFRTYMIYKDSETTDYFWWNGKEIKNKKDFIGDFPDEIIKQINDIVGNSPLYDMLLTIINGEEITDYQLRDSDELISNYKPSQNNPKKGIITIQFYNDDEYMELFNLDEDDKWAYDAVNNHYEGYEFMDSYSFSEEWKEGYLFGYFNDDNIQLVQELLQFIAPNLVDFEDDEDKRREVAKLLTKYFDDEVENIIYEISSESNAAKTRGFNEEVNYQVCEAFSSYGIFKKTCMRKYYTSVLMLMSFYKSAGDTTLTLSQLLSSVIDSSDYGWSDMMYEVQEVDFDEEGVNSEINRYVERMIEKAKDNPEFSNIEEYSEMVKRITNRYKINSRYETKYGKEFFIREFDPKTNKIHVQVSSKNGWEDRSYTEEEFENFIVSPELFERFIKKSKKIF